MAKNEKTTTLTSQIVGVIKWWYEFSSCSGITQAKASTSKISKVVWTLLAIVGVGVTYYMVYNAIISYLKNGTVTVVNMRNHHELEFPSVTICNPNRIHCLHLYDLIQSCTNVRA